MRLPQEAGAEARLKTEHVVLFAVLGCWSVVLLVWLLERAAATGSVFSGADGPFAADQLQYLAWVRDSSRHFLAGDLFDIPPSGRVFLHPMWFVSGLLVRGGLDVSFSLLPWKVVAVGALVWWTTRYAAHFLRNRWSRVGAVVLALFYGTPSLLVVAALGSSDQLREISRVAGELLVAGSLWGYVPTGLAIALIPAYLVHAERAVRGEKASVRSLVIASAAGVLASWLHPWQGVTIVLLTGLVVVAERLRPWTRRLVIPAAATALPLIGYAALASFDPAWQHAQSANEAPAPPVGYLALALAPVLLPALLAVRKPGHSFFELSLLAWPVAALVAVFVLPPFPQHALAGLAIPLSILAVRGMRNVIPRHFVVGGVVLLLTVPGTIYMARRTIDFVDATDQSHLLASGDVEAFEFLLSHGRPGGVLSPLYPGAAVPAWTGRPTWVGHPSWTPDFDRRVRVAAELASGELEDDVVRRVTARSGARFVLVPCSYQSRLTTQLRPLLVRVHTFGCATIYELR